MKEVLDFLKKTPIVTGVLALGFMVAGIQFVNTEGMLMAGIYRFILSFAMGAFLYLISGERVFEASKFRTCSYVIKSLIAFPIFSLALGLMLLGYNIWQKFPVNPSWPLDILSVVLFCLGVGVFEELIFRAILNDAIIYQFRKCKGVFVIAIIVSSFIFGYVHVMFEDMSNTAVFLPIAFKTISTGMQGACLTILYWKTRNIIGLAIIHALYDFFPIAPTMLFQSGQELGSYATTSNGGSQPVVWYVVQIVFEAIILLVLWKKVVKTIDFESLRKES